MSEQCEVCSNPDGATDDEMVVDFWDDSAQEGQKHKMAHVECAESMGWERA